MQISNFEFQRVEWGREDVGRNEEKKQDRERCKSRTSDSRESNVDGRMLGEDEEKKQDRER